MSRLRRCLAGGLIAGLLLNSPWLTPRPAAAAPNPVRLEWRAGLPQYRFTSAGRVQISVPGYALTDAAGLPFRSALIAVPPGHVPALTLEALDQTSVPLPAPLEVAPGPAPAAPVSVVPLGIMRGVTLARVVFYPVLADGAGLRVTTYARVTVSFTLTETVAAVSPPPADALLAGLRAQVVNPDAVQVPAAAAIQPNAAPAPAALIEVAAAGITAITYDALFAAGFPVGPGGLDPAALQLAQAGAPVALLWEGDGDAVFGPGERFLFYAAPRFNRYTEREVYRLSTAAGPVRRMTQRPAVDSAVTTAGAATTTALYEVNQIYTASACRCDPGRRGDRWMWEYLSRPGTDTRSFPFLTPAIDRAQPAALTVWLLGYTQANHRVELALNGAPLATALWSGQQAYTATLTVPAGALTAGQNTLTLSLPDADGIWLDAFQAAYTPPVQSLYLPAILAGLGQDAGTPVTAPAGTPGMTFTGEALPRRYTLAAAGAQVYDVTDPAQPIRLDNPVTGAGWVTLTDAAGSLGLHRYYAVSAPLAPAAVRALVPLSGAAGADVLILTHPDFRPALAPLVAVRQAQGLSVAVEDVRAVYDAGDGRATPENIRDFLSTVYQTWTPRPQYVLLVGDGTYDPRRYRADSQTTFIPPFLADVDPYLGETAAENRFAAVAGTDTLPDFALGRLPMNTLAEAQTVVDKLVAYETQPPAGAWPAQALFVADDADSGGNFPQDLETWATYLPPALTVQRDYLTPTASVAAVRQTLLAAWTAGLGLVVYNGHASPRQWGAEVFLHLDALDAPNVAALTNAGRLPLVLEMTCLSGSFHDAARPSLDEGLLRQPAGGAAGVWGATGLGLSAGHDRLAAGFLQALYSIRPARVGSALLAGKLELAVSGQHLDLLDTFLWLGDPATVAAR